MKVAIAENRTAGLQSDTALERREGVRPATEDSAARVAQHDYLTELPTWVFLQDRLSQELTSIERGGEGALLFVDLDHFNRVNGTMGHEMGDEVLQHVSQRLIDTLSPDDTVSRQGGDEFLCLLPRLRNPRDAAEAANKIIRAIEEPFTLHGRQVHLSASVGIALYPQNGRDAKTLVKQADVALSHAKKGGRAQYCYFADEMSIKMEQRIQIENELRQALKDGDLFLMYQPKVRLPDGVLIGMEALVRWRRASTGETVPPSIFIPVAEESGLIVALDEWVMHEACRQNHEWQEAGSLAVPVSVNVSLAKFDPERLIRQVRSTLKTTGLAPTWLEIEFTEGRMLGHLEGVRQLIKQLKGLGVQVAMDDFGTGYSCLASLVRYRFDVLKIDQSFIRGLPEDAKRIAIVRAIVSMATALNCRVIAEGVETQEQADTLQRIGCSDMQGYFYGRPVLAHEFSASSLQGHPAEAGA